MLAAAGASERYREALAANLPDVSDQLDAVLDLCAEDALLEAAAGGLLTDELIAAHGAARAVRRRLLVRRGGRPRVTESEATEAAETVVSELRGQLDRGERRNLRRAVAAAVSRGALPAAWDERCSPLRVRLAAWRRLSAENEAEWWALLPRSRPGRLSAGTAS
jgi:hypothetical protein